MAQTMLITKHQLSGSNGAFLEYFANKYDYAPLTCYTKFGTIDKIMALSVFFL
jgi:hypothetical protein